MSIANSIKAVWRGSILPNGWRSVCLGEITDIVMGNSPPGDSYNDDGIGTPLINGPVEFSDEPLGNTLRKKFTTSPTKMCKELDLLICVRGSTTGRTNVAAFVACIGRGVASIRAHQCQRYINHFICAERSRIFASGKGSAFPSISQQQLADIQIPLPPLAEQKRIADILDKADAIRRKRQEVVEVIATSYKSLFLSMFGDPVENHRRLPVKTIANLATRISKGESPQWQGFKYQDDGVQFITSENVRWGHLDTSTPKFIPHAFHAKLKRSQLAKDDLLINLVGASVGRTALVPETELPANVNQAVAVISVDRNQVLPSFLLHQLLNDRVQQVLLGNVVESARANISLTNIRETTVLVPEIEEQKAWNEIVRSNARLTDSSRRAWHECSDLFNSLQQRAFAGEL